MTKLDSFEDYLRFARYCVKCEYPAWFRKLASRTMAEDLGQEVYTLALEAFTHKMPLKKASSHIRRGLYRFAKSFGWKRSKAIWKQVIVTSDRID